MLFVTVVKSGVICACRSVYLIFILNVTDTVEMIVRTGPFSIFR